MSLRPGQAKGPWVGSNIPTGVITGAANVGAGTGLIFRDITDGNTINLKSLIAGAGISITNGADDITISTTDAVNTYWRDPFIKFYDPTGGLPGAPSTGDIYIATATANGWTVDRIYEYNGVSWDETTPLEGMTAWDLDTDLGYTWDGSKWAGTINQWDYYDAREPEPLTSRTGAIFQTGTGGCVTVGQYGLNVGEEPFQTRFHVQTVATGAAPSEYLRKIQMEYVDSGTANDAGACVTVYHDFTNGAVPTANYEIGCFTFESVTVSSGTPVQYGHLKGIIVDPATATVTGKIQISVAVNAVMTPRIDVHSTGVDITGLAYVSSRLGVGTAADGTASLKLSSIPALESASTAVLVSDSGIIKYRTPAQIISDGGGTAAHGVTVPYYPYASSTTAFTAGQLYYDSGNSITYAQRVTAITNGVRRPLIINHRLSGGSIASGMGTGLSFSITDTTPTETVLATLDFYTGTGTPNRGNMDLQINEGGSMISILKYASGSGSTNTFTVNDAKIDTDFTVHADTVDNMIFVDASAGLVGIATNTPGTSYILDVNGSIRCRGTDKGINFYGSGNSDATGRIAADDTYPATTITAWVGATRIWKMTASSFFINQDNADIDVTIGSGSYEVAKFDAGLNSLQLLGRLQAYSVAETGGAAYDGNANISTPTSINVSKKSSVRLKNTTGTNYYFDLTNATNHQVLFVYNESNSYNTEVRILISTGSPKYIIIPQKYLTSEIGGAVLVWNPNLHTTGSWCILSQYAHNEAFTLTDEEYISVDASRGDTVYNITLGGNRYMNSPPEPKGDGQMLIFRIKQDGTGSRTITWDSKYRFSTSLPSPTLTTTPGKTDILGFLYNWTDDRWDYIAEIKGF